MTIISNIKGSLASIKAMQSEFSHYAQVASDEQARAIFHECMLDVEQVAQSLQLRVEYMKAEELQYRKS
ncbi:DUF1657 domain-containing protein [Lederbergia lenta]|uniref:DUF1657 domain-containing protein n=1 Tax=Lederbergia lenta TaxID=1467 RepID=UPI000824E10C|nr:DUF1657 domain-containing protein [Lederbergia lenta]MCM3109445.1 DUF1657 domain-containing protein [Lederbergia lenta]MEC2324790.1 DUF1657 domain-containing protein [Lederbergia lenta]